jgi:hypothetical protein
VRASFSVFVAQRLQHAGSLSRQKGGGTPGHDNFFDEQLGRHHFEHADLGAIDRHTGEFSREAARACGR